MIALPRFVSFLLLALILAPSGANAWWNGDWSYRKKITLDAGPMGAALTEDAGRMPVLIRLHDGNFRFSDAKEDGSDLRFVDSDDKTPLKFHIDTYDGVLGIALVWVDMPMVRAGATAELYLYYGNIKAPVGADPRGTYDVDQTLVYHFAERAAPPRDETAYNNAGQGVATPVDNSIIGRGVRFNGATVVTVPRSPSLTIAAGGQFSWSVWVKPDAAGTAVIYAKRDGGVALVIGLDQGAPYVSVTNGAQVARTPMTAVIAPMNWHHLAVTASDRITLYVDGKQAAALTAVLPALAGPATLGGDITAPATGAARPTPVGFVGELDELEIAKTARGPGYVAAAFVSQGPDSKMLAYGQDEENAGFSAGYFGIILRSVTIDGWVVIALLMVMAAISWVVMGTKARTVSKVARANAIFLDAFGRADDIGTFAVQLSANTYHDLDESVLFRVCEAGGAELARRDAAARGGPLMLSPQAIDTIRANLDRVAAYESQRLNSLMVLLTIAISGGPFLGLLGTVVGVMITFAAIAATGDVNVNAIAPGIAAALVATVAGLGVAIPALFGYNYLITRIKDITTEMHAFTDEFVTRVAEAYPHRSDFKNLAAE
jgi:biopolymer transport protein ExbB